MTPATRSPGNIAAHLRRRAQSALLVFTVAALATGVGAWIGGMRDLADLAWAAGTLVATAPALWWVIATLRRGQLGADIIAVLSLIGTLAVHEYLAGSLIAVMLATGHALDAAAQRRATRDLRALLQHAPRFAHRRTGDAVHTVPLSEVQPDDLLLVRPGEVVPVDGSVTDGVAVLDESVLTGEPLHVDHPSGEVVRSGTVNAGAAFDLRATATADDSTYAGIVRMAREASAQSAPTVRLADHYAAWFLPLSLMIAGGAWLISGSAVRAVAVLVVATPCPLLLAAPVAIVSGLSRASRRGLVIRDGAALENLGHARTLLMDKTGTLTAGRPVVTDIAAAPETPPDEVLRLAASLEQASPHVLAEAIVQEARTRSLPLSIPRGVTEQPGLGVNGTLDGHRVQVGKLGEHDSEAPWASAVRTRAVLDGAAVAWLRVDDQLRGAVLLRDPLRRDAPRTLRRLRNAGLRRLVMLTGDRPEPAEEIATVVGLDAVHAEQTPSDKVTAARTESNDATTVMVGDGVNDAPALAAATVGVALGARGSTASSETADVVLTTDRLDRLADAIDIARRSRRIAVQSAAGGMVLSLIAMVIAALGWLPPAVGALLQEGIDIAVILNALRALRGTYAPDVVLTSEVRPLLQRFSAEHDELRDTLPLIRATADLLAAGFLAHALAELRRTYRFLTDNLLPHERAEETQLYPALTRPLGSTEATATMSRMHAEIERLSKRIATHLQLAEHRGAIQPDQINDLLPCLYGLHTLLRLHFVQEEENYFALADDLTTPDASQPKP
jgi:heavy metal translocating P-type ATPase